MSSLVHVKAETHSAQMAAKPGAKEVHALVSVSMPRETEGQVVVATRYLLVLDHSTSTDGKIPSETNDMIIEIMQKATCSIVDLMGENDEVGVVQFAGSCTEQDVLLEPTRCDVEGKAQAEMEIKSMEPNGGTDFAKALKQAQQYLPAGFEKNMVLIFASDGDDYGNRPEALALCEQLRARGTTVYTVCINSGTVGNAGEQHLSAMAGDKYFTSAKTAAEVRQFFDKALRISQRAAVTNAVVQFRPIKSVFKVDEFALVAKNGTGVYVAGSINETGGRIMASAPIDNVGPGDLFEIHLLFHVNVKPFSEGFVKEDQAFGQVLVTGSCKSMGIENQELARTDMAVTFAANPARAKNLRVERIIGIADGKRAEYVVANTTDAVAQRQIIQDAKAKVAGTMALTGSDDATLQAVLAGLGDLEQTAGQGAGAVAQKARTGTQVLRADDADAALAGLE